MTSRNDPESSRESMQRCKRRTSSASGPRMPCADRRTCSTKFTKPYSCANCRGRSSTGIAAQSSSTASPGKRRSVVSATIFSAERIVGMHVADVVGMEVFEQTAKPYLDRCFDGEEGSYAGWFSNALGRRYMAGTCSPLRPHSEPVESALVIVRDLTEHMLASEALREAQAELAHVTRVTTLGEVTASFAHELNQPLAAILNNANACLGLLPSGRADLDEVRDALADIVTDADRASAIIERVRGLAKRSSPEQVPLQLVDVVADIVALAAAESVARRVAIRTDIPTDLPVVLGDRVQLQQVLLNLLVNVMDA